VAANKGVVRAFEQALGLSPGELIIPRYHASMGAIGAVLQTVRSAELRPPRFDWLGTTGAIPSSASSRTGETPFCLSGSTVPHHVDYEKENERTAYTMVHSIPDGMIEDVFIGVDIGSLSTNVVAIDRQKRVVARRYLRTAGRPLVAVQRGLAEIGEEIGDRVRVHGIGTTGSGRYLSGDFVGADVVRNEITAQAVAAIEIDPTVDTIFEIGGQDSKYVGLHRGAVVDFTMNKVCAAGTGSFLEEQAEKLNIDIVEDFGTRALAAHTPADLGDRCTVFMESDLIDHQQRGAELNDLVAGLSYSIVHNYLNRVVGERRIGERIFFQGGVAWNRGVVKAFEDVTGKSITVPPHHDVTGAIGAAILAMEWADAHPEEETTFKGFDLSTRTYESTTVVCKACENTCEIRKVTFQGERPRYYGTRCERFEIDTGAKQEERDIPDLFAERQEMLLGSLSSSASGSRTGGRPRIGIPRTLSFYELLPFWRSFFETLGCEVVLSPESTRPLIRRSIESSVAETCFPARVVHGHVLHLAESDVDAIFLPSIINQDMSEKRFVQNYLCPIVQAIPYVIRAAFEGTGLGVELLTPPVHFGSSAKRLAKDLEPIAHYVGASSGEFHHAIDEGNRQQRLFREHRMQKGKEILDELHKWDRAVVIISRAYNGCDRGINLDLPRKLADLGALAIPIDLLPLEEIDISDRYPDMYWWYGQKILAAAELVARTPRLQMVYLTNFKCGPDSFILHLVREVLGGKPFLQLEIDEHSADAGIVTRCEAFFDSIEGARRSPPPPPVQKPGRTLSPVERDGRAIYIPRMADHALVIAAAYRACGVEAHALPPSDQETLQLGRQYTSGRECFPFLLTTGDFLKKLRDPHFDPSRSAFFMATADGPCRFGQYHRLQRMLLDELGLRDLTLITPGSGDAYTKVELAGRGFQKLGWRGVVATDILTKLLHQTRPYERVPGSADRLYARALRKICREVEAGGNTLSATMREIAEEFRGLQISRTARRPVIGIVGEIYIRSNSFSNSELIRRIEALGGEVSLAPIAEWFYYTNYRCKQDSLSEGNWPKALKVWLKNLFQRLDERRLVELASDLLESGQEPPTERILEKAAPYLHASFGGEAILSVGKSVELIESGVSGIVNVMPFTCMPGMIVAAISKQLREHFPSIPWLNLSYDGQKDLSIETRLEAFIHQTRASTSPQRDGERFRHALLETEKLEV
ncbi:hypothetical protein AMJ71_02900, partial [candidate division TA06 bacterium SM1_40]